MSKVLQPDKITEFTDKMFPVQNTETANVIILITKIISLSFHSLKVSKSEDVFIDT